MLNHIVIMGRLVRDPDLRNTMSGISVASFTVAVDRDFQSRDSGEKTTDFIDCVAWRQTGEFVSKYFTKGSMIVVSGKLQIREWTDKEGNKRRNAEIVADNVYFGSSRRDDGQSTGSYTGSTAASSGSASRSSAPAAGQGGPFSDLSDEDGDLPF